MSDFIIPVHVVAAGGIIRNGYGDILLIRSERRGWEFPGGIIEQGEDIISGLKREIMEESGARVQVNELFCVSSNTCFVPGYNGVESVPPKVVFDFICTYEDGEFMPNEESYEAAFVPQNEVLERLTVPNFIDRFKAYLEYSGRPTYLSFETYPVYNLNIRQEI